MMHYSAISPSARAGGEISLVEVQIELAWESYSMNLFGIAIVLLVSVPECVWKKVDQHPQHSVGSDTTFPQKPLQPSCISTPPS
jgi:hypothetical protein